jgi:hypothetical protein
LLSLEDGGLPSGCAMSLFWQARCP